MAVLEAFVYDPLINWRLMQPDVERRGESTSIFDLSFSPRSEPVVLRVTLYFR